MRATSAVIPHAVALVATIMIACCVPPRGFTSPPTKSGGIDVSRKANPLFVRPEPARLEFSLDWTKYQMHRISDTGPIEILLPGRIMSDIANVWTLASGASELPALIFVEDIFGGNSPPHPNIPVTCAISLDSQPFQLMTASNGSLSTVFPPGMHTFQVRITGIPNGHLQPGYYRLQLSQNLVPQL